MKTKEIVVGESYALARSRYQVPREVVVLETGVRREGFGIGKDGVRVQFWNDHAGRKPFIVASRELRRKWSEHKAQTEAYDARVKAERKRQAAEKASCADLVAALDSAGVTAARGAGMGVVVPFESFEAMYDLVRAARAWRKRSRAVGARR